MLAKREYKDPNNVLLVEWDILGVPAERNVKFYTCCDEPYLDITFNITMRRNIPTHTHHDPEKILVVVTGLGPPLTTLVLADFTIFMGKI